MICALLLLQQAQTQFPLLSDDQAIAMARKFASQFPIERIDVVKVHRHPYDNYTNFSLEVKDDLGLPYRIFVDGRRRVATAITRADGNYNSSGQDEPPSEKLAAAVKILSSLHNGATIQVTHTQVGKSKFGDELLSVYGHLMLKGKPVMVASVNTMYEGADQTPYTTVSYHPAFASGQFVLDTMRPASVSVKEWGFTLDDDPVKADVRSIKERALKLAKAHVAALRQKIDPTQYSDPTLEEPQVVQLVKPNSKVAKNCYMVKSVFSWVGEVSRAMLFYEMYFDGQTGDVIPSGRLDPQIKVATIQDYKSPNLYEGYQPRGNGARQFSDRLGISKADFPFKTGEKRERVSRFADPRS